MCDPLPLPLDSKYHNFALLKENKDEFAKNCVHYGLQKKNMLLLTVNQNSCNPWAFLLMVYKCGR